MLAGLDPPVLLACLLPACLTAQPCPALLLQGRLAAKIDKRHLPDLPSCCKGEQGRAAAYSSPYVPGWLGVRIAADRGSWHPGYRWVLLPHPAAFAAAGTICSLGSCCKAPVPASCRHVLHCTPLRVELCLPCLYRRVICTACTVPPALQWAVSCGHL
jgi:hypothetical protein